MLNILLSFVCGFFIVLFAVGGIDIYRFYKKERYKLIKAEIDMKFKIGDFA